MMKEQEQVNYNRIAEAIDFIDRNFRAQPGLEEIAGYVKLSPYHFHRLFTEWAGISPKKFLQYISVEHAKKILKENQATLFETALETGLSGPGRLHDLFISIERMTPGEYKNGGENLSLNYSFAESPFGNIIIASTTRGVSYLAFAESIEKAFDGLQRKFPNAGFRRRFDLVQQNALSVFNRDWSSPARVKLHLKGTDFQIKVWETLLKIPLGQLSTYGTVASHLENPGASRAVGSAIGRNPVAFLIPCHRVIQSTGLFGGYHWGGTRKTAMIGWEIAAGLKMADLPED